ncbi:glycosyltransferase [Micromonospora sp. WMMD987]|uniref:glycosyltransferase n=1 Tax=Micromonospora sp. WMMD987 TaxID=3016089 RepID=UPI00249B4407|nr:glycosyltransferase [Micromonospora sp. WMMD987]WFE97542.1 glycosyltransferase [Micromonospora sp. WMMD987]
MNVAPDEIPPPAGPPERAVRVLLASLPSTGLIRPLLEIAQELNERGVAELWFASTEEGRDAVERIPGPDRVRFVSLGHYKAALDPSRWDDATLASMSSPSRLRNLAAFLDKNVDHEYTAQQYDRAVAEFARVRPDVAVIDLCTPWAIDAAVTLGVPYVLSVPVPISGVYLDRLPWSFPTPFSGLPLRMSRRQRLANVAFRLGAMATYARPRNLLPMLAATRRRRRAGIANAAAVPSRYADAAAAVLSFSVFGLEYRFPAAPDHLHMVGTLMPRATTAGSGDAGIDAWLESYRSVVYIGFGTVMRPTRELVAAVAAACTRLDPDVGVLWKVSRAAGSAFSDALPDPPPDNLKVVGWVPSQLGLLAHPRVRVFFGHGGGNAVNEGLVFGKPLLILPFWMDCHDLAARVVEAGVGLSVDGADVDQIVDGLRRLLDDDGFRDRAERLGRRLSEAGGVARAADVVLACAPSRRSAASLRP